MKSEIGCVPYNIFLCGTESRKTSLSLCPFVHRSQILCEIQSLLDILRI